MTVVEVIITKARVGLVIWLGLIISRLGLFFED